MNENKKGVLTRIKEGKYYQAAKESFQRIWQYKTIWIWGLLIGSGASLDFGGESSENPDEFANFQQTMGEFVSLYWGWIVLGVLLVIALGLLCWFLSMVARAGVIKELNEKQNKKNYQLGFKKIWHIGKNHFSKMFYLDLALLAVVLGVLLFNAIFIFSALWASQNLFMMILIGILIFISILFLLFVAILKPFAQVFILLSNMEIKESFGRSWMVIKNNLKEFLKLVLVNLVIVILEMIVIGVIALIVGILGFGFYAMFAGGGIELFFLAVFGGIFGLIVLVAFLAIRGFCALWRMDILIWWVKMVDGAKSDNKKAVGAKKVVAGKKVAVGARA